jgi:hypothetical protein
MIFFPLGWREVSRDGPIDQEQKPRVVAFVHGEVLEQSRARRLSFDDFHDVFTQFIDRIGVARHAFQIVERIVARMVGAHEVAVFTCHTSRQTRQVDGIDGLLP